MTDDKPLVFTPAIQNLHFERGDRFKWKWHGFGVRGVLDRNSDDPPAGMEVAAMVLPGHNMGFGATNEQAIIAALLSELSEDRKIVGYRHHSCAHAR